MTEQHYDQHDSGADALFDEALTRLRDAGERVTAPRRSMLRVLAADGGHYTAEELAEAVEGVHRATVFRSLDVFVDAGVVTYRQVPSGATSYHLVTGGHLHAHCVDCGKVTALPPNVFDSAQEALTDAVGFVFNPNRSTISGLCTQCAARQHASH